MEFTPLPPKEAIEFFEQKSLTLSFDHRDVDAQEHQTAHTVAKCMQLDVLEDIHRELSETLRNGTTYEQFMKNITPSLKAKGWWGVVSMTDPLTGEVREVQAGSRARLKKIYDVNLRTAHAEGQWERIQATKDAFPYLQYDGRNSHHNREEHAGYDGLVLPVDAVFWQLHYPPKGYGCKCRVLQRTTRWMEKNNREPDAEPQTTWREWVNQRTGEVKRVPDGVDPSFHYPPGGRRAALTDVMCDKLARAQPAVARACIRSSAHDGALESWLAAPAGDWPVAVAEAVDMHPVVRLSAQAAGVEAGSLATGDVALVQEVIDSGARLSGSTADEALFVLTRSGLTHVVTVLATGKVRIVTAIETLAADVAAADPRLLKS